MNVSNVDERKLFEVLRFLFKIVRNFAGFGSRPPKWKWTFSGGWGVGCTQKKFLGPGTWANQKILLGLGTLSYFRAGRMVKQSFFG